jgi:hypothetical protein
VVRNRESLCINDIQCNATDAMSELAISRVFLIPQVIFTGHVFDV